MLGALIDLGISEQLIEHELKSMGFECKISAQAVERKGVKARLARVSAQNRSFSLEETMALVDSISNAKIRNRMAKVIDIIAETEFEYAQILTLLASLTAEHFTEADRCVTSPVNAGNDKTAIGILKSAQIDITSDNPEISTTDKFGAAYLSAFASEICAFCSYDIIKTGYGAGEADFDISNVLRAVIAQDGDLSRMEELYKSTSEEFSVI